MADIVLGYDGSESAKEALAVAVGLAKDLGATLVIGFAYGQNPVGGGAGDLAREVETLGEGLLETAVAEAKAVDASVEVETEQVNGESVEGLHALATARGARMLVIGGASSGPIWGTVSGSVVYRIVADSPVPVLVVNPAE